MGWELQKTVVMVGMMGSGKTAIGTALARRLNVPFRDSDHELERASNMTVAEIFARDGEPFFREKETQIITRLLDDTPGVLSTGGGAFMSATNRQIIHDKGVSVLLDADVPLLWSRVKRKDTRPLLRTSDPRKTLEGLFSARMPFYELADLRVKGNPAYSIEEMTDKVVEVLLTRPDVLKEV